MESPVKYSIVMLILNMLVFVPRDAAYAQGPQTTIVFKVIDDENHGVNSEIRMGPPPTGTHFRDTGADGMLQVEHHCKDGEQFFAIPRDMVTYRKSVLVDCSKIVTLKVTSVAYDATLRRGAQMAVSADDHAKAAMFFNDLYKRTEVWDQNASEGFRVKALQEAAKSLNVETPTVQDSGREVMSPELRESLSEFQQKTGLDVNGKLDYSTLRSLAGTDIGAAVAAAK